MSSDVACSLVAVILMFECFQFASLTGRLSEAASLFATNPREKSLGKVGVFGDFDILNL